MNADLHMHKKFYFILFGITIAFVAIAIFSFGPLAAGKSANSNGNNVNGKGKSQTHAHVSFAVNVEVKSVNPGASTITAFVDDGSLTAHDIYLSQQTFPVDPNAKFIVSGSGGDATTTLKDISQYQHAYLFGIDINGTYTVNKIIVHE